MMDYNEDEYLQLAGIQHFLFCRRQWALIHIEQQWNENVLTAEGNLLHEKAHDGYTGEKRNGTIISRGMPIQSRVLGISGICDIVEFRKSEDGISLYGQEGTYNVYPVEYKRGKPKEDDMDRMQLTAQAMCLEEMLCCTIVEAYLYYGETRHRVKVEITEEMKRRCEGCFEEMHQLYKKGYTPKVKKSKSCRACSLNELCLPQLSNTMEASQYILQHVQEEQG